MNRGGRKSNEDRLIPDMGFAGGVGGGLAAGPGSRAHPQHIFLPNEESLKSSMELDKHSHSQILNIKIKENNSLNNSGISFAIDNKSSFFAFENNVIKEAQRNSPEHIVRSHLKSSAS
mmetsp:Transcript_12833/g.19866  ORF Transcript_12833/g.19866 Transcript_12833/m.19866 type:complete len:118 (-) Transcript_12833:1313-1666(-)